MAAALRILFMTDTPPDPDSGAAGTEFQTIAALRAMGHHVDAVWSDELPRRIAHGNLHYLLELPRTYRRAMREKLARAPYDVVHASQPHGWLAAREARRRGKSPVFVHRSHGFEPRIAQALRPWQPLAPRPSPLRSAANALMASLLESNNRAIARWAHGHIVSSSLCADMLRERYAVPAPRIAVIAQAAPPAFLRTPPPAFEANRLERLLYVGQFAFFKAPMMLARAFEHIVQAHPATSLTWVCSAAHHPHVRALLGPAANERLRLVDWMPQDELLRVYDEHGVFVFPSFAEGFGKAVVEAMARGLAVIASDEGGAHDLIDDGRNGIKVPVGDAHAIARAYSRLRSDPEWARQVAVRGHETAAQCTWERVAGETAAFYERLIGMQ